jgi:hypothetical protein
MSPADDNDGGGSGSLSKWLQLGVPIVAFGALLAWGLTSPERMKMSFVHGAYYTFWLLLVAWVVVTWRWVQRHSSFVKEVLRSNWPGLVFVLLVVVAVFLSVPIELKVLSDEANLVSLSRSLARDRVAYNPVMDLQYHGRHHPLDPRVPIRPLGFPFLLSLLHAILGVRAENAFVLNFLVLFSLLSLVYLTTRRFLSTPAAVGAVLLVVAQPIVTITATSAGFDLLSLLFFLISLLCTHHYLRERSASSLALLAVNLLFFANIRYESIALCTVIVIYIAVTRHLRLAQLRANVWLYSSVPLLLLMALWQRILSRNRMQKPRDDDLISLAHFKEHLVVLAKTHVRFDFMPPYANGLNLLSLALFCLLLVRFLRKRGRVGERHDFHFIVVAALTVGLSTCIFLAHFLGRATLPTSARFFLVLSLTFSLIPVVSAYVLPFRASRYVLLGLGLVAALTYHPVAVAHRYMNKLTLTRRTWYGYRFLEEVKRPGVHVISDRPVNYSALGYGAMSFSYANKNASSVIKKLRCGMLDSIYVFQRLDADGGKPKNGNRLSKRYPLETVREAQLERGELLRISEIRLPEERRTLEGCG